MKLTNYKNIQQASLKIFSWWIVVSLFSLALFFILMLISENREELYLYLVFPLVIFVHYTPLRIALPKLIDKGVINLYRNNTRLTGKGPGIIPLSWGLLWRSILLSSITSILFSGLGDIFKSADQLSMSILNFALVMFSAYLSVYWLLKWQYGNVKISFDTDQNMVNEFVPENIDNQSLEVVKEGTKSILSTVAILSYFGVGIIQIVAIFTFFTGYLNWWFLPSLVSSIFVAYIPIIGGIVGALAAIEVWGWTWYFAVLLFFFPIVLFIFASGLMGLVSLFGKNR